MAAFKLRHLWILASAFFLNAIPALSETSLQLPNVVQYSFYEIPDDPNSKVDQEFAILHVNQDNIDLFLNEISHITGLIDHQTVEIYESDYRGLDRSTASANKPGVFGKLFGFFQKNNLKTTQITIPEKHNSALITKIKKHSNLIKKAYSVPSSDAQFTAIITGTYRATVVTTKLIIIKGLNPIHAMITGGVQGIATWAQTRWGPQFLDKILSGRYRGEGMQFNKYLETSLRLSLDFVLLEIFRFISNGGNFDALFAAKEQLDILTSTLLIGGISAKVQTIRNKVWQDQHIIKTRVGLFQFFFTAPFSIMQQYSIGPELFDLGFYQIKAATAGLIGVNAALIYSLIKYKNWYESQAVKNERYFIKGKQLFAQLHLISNNRCKSLHQKTSDEMKEYLKNLDQKVSKDTENFRKFLLDWKNELNQTK